MSKIKIILNGEEKFLQQKTSIFDLINNLEIDVKKIAIEKDLQIIDPQDFPKILLEEGSRIEIVHFIGGG